MTMITPSYLGETIEYSSLHACRSTLEDPTAITTGAMLRLGKAYGNLMIDLTVTSAKLRDRGERIVMECCAVDRERARVVIAAAGNNVKVAIVMARLGADVATARRALDAAGGSVRRVVGDPPPVSPPARR